MWMGQSAPVVILMSNYCFNDVYEMRRPYKVITIDFHFCFCCAQVSMYDTFSNVGSSRGWCCEVPMFTCKFVCWSERQQQRALDYYNCVQLSKCALFAAANAKLNKKSSNMCQKHDGSSLSKMWWKTRVGFGKRICAHCRECVIQSADGEKLIALKCRRATIA